MSAERRPIAVVLDGPPTPAWQRRALANLAESPALQLVGTRLAGRPRRNAVRRAHDALDRHLLKLGPDALKPTFLNDLMIEPLAAASSPGALVVWLSERPVPEDERRDVLALCHGGVAQPADDAFCRAVLGGRSCLETELLLRGAAGTVVVERTVSEVRPFSVTLSRDLALWKLAGAMRRGAERAPGLDLPARPPSRPQTAPSSAALIARAAVTWPRVLAARLLFRRPWHVRVRRRGGRATADWADGTELVRFRRGHLYADPFLFEHEGRHHLFCEEVPRGATRGVISHAELCPDGTLADPPATVLEAPYHLSYPCVFAHAGELFMIPESSAAGRVELYRAVEFPRRWRREAILLDGIDAADSTILAHQDRWWLFAGVAAANASSLDELHLFWASTPLGPWVSHPANPIVSDARGARPAGAILRWGERLVRPAQDCSRRYGWAVSFREIDVLSTSDYAEHEIDRIEPADVGARATHSYTADERFEAIDLRRRELRLARGRGAGFARGRGADGR